VRALANPVLLRAAIVLFCATAVDVKGAATFTASPT